MKASTATNTDQKLPNNKKRKFNNKKTQAKSLSRDDKQDKEIARLKKLVKVQAPPTKTTYVETTLSPENTWAAFGIPFPAKGGAANQRLGDDIEFKSLNVRYLVSASESDDFDTMRVILIQFMNGNEHDEFPVNYFQDLWESPTTSYPYLSPYNTQSSSNYKVLYDQMHHLDAAGEAEQSGNVLILPKDLRVTKFHFDTDSGGALAGLDRGIIIGFVCSNSTASPNPDFTCTMKFNFTDT